MEGNRLLFCLPGQIQTHHLRPEGRGRSREVHAEFLKSSQSTLQLPQIFPFCPWYLDGLWLSLPLVCLCVCLCLYPAGSVLLPSTSRPGTTRWKTTPIPTPMSVTPGVQNAAPGPCAPITLRWDDRQTTNRLKGSSTQSLLAILWSIITYCMWNKG